MTIRNTNNTTTKPRAQHITMNTLAQQTNIHTHTQNKTKQTQTHTHTHTRARRTLNIDNESTITNERKSNQ